MDGSASSPLTIRSLQVRAANVPLTPPLQTAAGTLRTAPLVQSSYSTTRAAGSEVSPSGSKVRAGA